jgi:hypothetical protein
MSKTLRKDIQDLKEQLTKEHKELSAQELEDAIEYLDRIDRMLTAITTGTTVAIDGSTIAITTRTQAELEKEPVPCHDGWLCGCEACVGWRKRNRHIVDFERWAAERRGPPTKGRQD